VSATGGGGGGGGGAPAAGAAGGALASAGLAAARGATLMERRYSDGLINASESPARLGNRGGMNGKAGCLAAHNTFT